ncbi:MAG TPA: hypothetical protein VF193_15300 [Steroidobacter sp.]
MSLPLITTLALAAGSAPAQSCPYENLLPEFAEFVQETRDLEATKRARAFVEQFAARHPDYYSERMFGSHEELEKQAVRLFDPAQIPKFEGARAISLDDVLTTGRVLTREYDRIEADFRRAFPDYRCGTPITFGLSLYTFDGNQSEDAPGKPRMRFGVDMIALLHSSRALPAFFHHELFHIYQAQKLGAAMPAEETQPVWWALWVEGLATYVSWKLNPSLAAPEIFWMPRDLEEQLKPKLAEAARMIQPELDGHEGYRRWFMAGSNPPGLPTRSGYYLGYLLARHLDQGDLAALARMEPAEVRREAHAFIDSLAKRRN